MQWADYDMATPHDSAPPAQGKILLEKGGTDPAHRAFYQIQKNLGYVVHISASDIMRGYNGEVIFVKVPIGFHLWKYWTQVPGTDTWRVVDTKRERIWLYLFTTFRSKMLTQALLHASDPWFCQQKHTSLVDVLMPRTPSRRDEADGREASETEDSSSDSESE